MICVSVKSSVNREFFKTILCASKDDATVAYVNLLCEGDLVVSSEHVVFPAEALSGRT